MTQYSRRGFLTAILVSLTTRFVPHPVVVWKPRSPGLTVMNFYATHARYIAAVRSGMFTFPRQDWWL